MHYYNYLGNQPSGKMKITRLAESLNGYENCGTIRILFTFPAGLCVWCHAWLIYIIYAHIYAYACIVKRVENMWRYSFIYSYYRCIIGSYIQVNSWAYIHAVMHSFGHFLLCTSHIYIDAYTHAHTLSQPQPYIHVYTHN